MSIVLVCCLSMLYTFANMMIIFKASKDFFIILTIILRRKLVLTTGLFSLHHPPLRNAGEKGALGALWAGVFCQLGLSSG